MCGVDGQEGRADQFKRKGGGGTTKLYYALRLGWKGSKRKGVGSGTEVKRESKSAQINASIIIG